MKILMINVVCGIKSTGRICTDIADVLEKQGHEVKIAYGRENVPEKYKKYAYRIGNDFDIKLHGIKARIFDDSGFESKKITKEFIKWIEEYNPDIIHLHNIHGYFINVEILFQYLKNCGKKIVWTLHDCWAFTGHCSYFDYIQCDKWKERCYACPQKHEYPESILLDNSARNYMKKEKLFTKVNNMILVTPSRWLEDLLKESYLKKYPVEVIHNGVDIKTFKFTQSNLRQSLNIEGRKVILGVAAVWNRRKGLKDFLSLSKKLDNSFKIILIGLSKKQIELLPNNIIGINRTNNTEELAALYSLADVYVNTTYEDNYPTTNIEAIACKTPVISYDTGGSSESAKLYGTVVKKGNIDELYNAIKEITDNKKKINFEIKNISVEQMVKHYLKIYFKEKGEKI